MPNTLFKLEEITKEYTIFEDDQVLTKNQLNEVVNYFEDQTRMTRTLLLGVGLVCGLSFRRNAVSGHIIIGPGHGITTDGDLLKISSDTTFTKFKEFDDSNSKYPPFWSGENQIKLWKLYTGTEEPPVESLVDLKDFTSDAVTINQVAVILYLEFFHKDADICTTIDCDNLGSRQIARQHVLFIRKVDLDELIKNHDTIYSKYGNNWNVVGVEEFRMPRVLFNSANTTSFSAIFQAYALPLKKMASQLINQLITLYATYHELIDPDLNIDTESWKKRIQELLLINISKSGVGIQYLYDAIKDICDTHNEILVAIRRLCSLCCPPIAAFPKHIMIREVVLPQAGALPRYRHKFYPTPIHEHHQSKTEIKLLLLKLNHLILDFNFPIGVDPVKITPSYLRCSAGHNRAIPYYYDPLDLFKVWNHSLTSVGRSDENLSYYSELYSNKDFVTDPLKYRIDKHDFLRIEGHINQDIISALKSIQNLRTQYGLPFDVIALRLNNLFQELDFEDYKCYFEDLEVLLRAWIAELNCLWKDLAGFFSKFSTREEAVHMDYKMVAASDSFRRAEFVTGRSSKDTAVKIIDGPAYRSNAVVIDHVTKAKDSVGEKFIEVNEAQPEGCPGDLKDDIINRIKDAAPIANWKKENVELAINYPAYLLSNAHILAFAQPENILDLSEKTINEFAKKLAALCKRTNSFRTFASGYFASDNYTKKGYEAQYLYLLDKINDGCCAAEKLEELFKEIIERKEEIIKQTLLSEYVKKHPGIEHTGGVPMGGTFILVYEDKSPGRPFESLAQVRANVSRQSALLKNNLRFPGKGLIDDVRTKEAALIVRGREEQLGLEELIVVSGQSIPRYTVVADFSLPYLCCSDCPPMTFIIPEQKVKLRIKDHICFDEATRPVEFLVEPADGEITADKGGEAIVKTDGRTFFDAQKLPVALHGQLITFRVNGQETGVTTIVIRKPQPVFEFSIEVFNELRKVAIVNFENHTEERAGESINYEWHFGDGDTSTERSPKHQYKLPLPNSNTVQVILVASNGLCSGKSEEISIEFGERGGVDSAREIKKNAEELGALDTSALDNELELVEFTKRMYKIVLNDIDLFLKGERNELLDEFAEPSNQLHKILNQQRVEPKIKEPLAAVMVSQFYLALNVLRDQKDDLQKLVGGNSRAQTERFKFLNSMEAKLETGRKVVEGFDKDKQILKFFESYDKQLNNSRPTLKAVVSNALNSLKS